MPINTAPNYTQAALNSPLAGKAYASLAAKYLPKNSAGNVATGFKGVSGLKGGAIGIGGEIAAHYLKPKEDQPIFGGEYGNITDKYDRRLQTAGPGIMGGAVKGATTGAQYGGGYGALAGAVIGGAYGAAKKHATTAYSDFKPEQMPGLITDAYRQYLGRDPEAGLVDNWMKGQGWKPGDKGVGQKHVFEELDSIKNSPEAMAYKGGTNLGTVNTAPSSNFTPMPIPSSFLSADKVAMLDDYRKKRRVA